MATRSRKSKIENRHARKYEPGSNIGPLRRLAGGRGETFLVMVSTAATFVICLLVGKTEDATFFYQNLIKNCCGEFNEGKEKFIRLLNLCARKMTHVMNRAHIKSEVFFPSYKSNPLQTNRHSG